MFVHYENFDDIFLCEILIYECIIILFVFQSFSYIKYTLLKDALN